MPEYGSCSYWDERYATIVDKDGSSYEWYVDWAQLRPLVKPFLKGKNPSEMEILVPGCGTSALGAHLYDDGYTNVTCVDSSNVVVNQMSDLYAEKDQMDYTTMNACHMEFIPDACFDVIIDKALLDCKVCSDSNYIDVTNLVSEMFRVLKTGGIYVVVSHGPPETRLGYLTANEKGINKYNWEIVTKKIKKPDLASAGEDENTSYFWIYICRK